MPSVPVRSLENAKFSMERHLKDLKWRKLPVRLLKSDLKSKLDECVAPSSFYLHVLKLLLKMNELLFENETMKTVMRAPGTAG